MPKQARWIKVLVLFLAGLMVVFPTFTQVAVAQIVPAQEQETPTLVKETSVPLPQGRELGDEELLQAEGEFFWFFAFAVVFGGARAVYENWFDEDYGIDKDDLKGIAGTALGAGVGGAYAGTIAAAAAWINK
jgi:hypothetical protein